MNCFSCGQKCELSVCVNPECDFSSIDDDTIFRNAIKSLRAELERVKAENEWIPCETRLPESLRPVFAKVKMNGKIFIVAAQYVAPKTVLASDFLDDEYREGAEEYDEEMDDYWVVEGWWENSIESDVNWKLSGEVIEWRPLPAAPEEGE